VHEISLANEPEPARPRADDEDLLSPFVDIRRTRPARHARSRDDSQARRRWSLAIAAVAVVGLLIAGVALRSVFVSTTRTSTILAAQLSSVCSAPSSAFARFWQDANATPVDYSGGVKVGDASVPAQSMYISDGPAGQGVLCVTTTAQANRSTQSLLEATAPRPDAIAYLNNHQGAPFGAVRPGVARVTIGVAGSSATQTFTLDGQAGAQLQPVGGGWHAFNSPYEYASITGSSVLTIRAFDARNHPLDSVMMTVAAADADSSGD
jgi:hypothetical protein